MPSLKLKEKQIPLSSYTPRGRNVLQSIFRKHFDDFKEQYDEKYAQACGNYRIEITEVAEEFIKCGDYKEGLARVKCQNPKVNYCFLL